MGCGIAWFRPQGPWMMARRDLERQLKNYQRKCEFLKSSMKSQFLHPFFQKPPWASDLVWFVKPRRTSPGELLRPQRIFPGKCLGLNAMYEIRTRKGLWLLLCKEICHIRRLSGVICLNYTIKENIFPLLKMAIQCVKQFHGQTLQARLTCKAKKMWKPGTLHNHTLCRHTLHKHTLHKNTLCRNTLCKNTFRRNTRWKSKSESCWS